MSRYIRHGLVDQYGIKTNAQTASPVEAIDTSNAPWINKSKNDSNGQTILMEVVFNTVPAGTGTTSCTLITARETGLFGILSFGAVSSTGTSNLPVLLINNRPSTPNGVLVGNTYLTPYTRYFLAFQGKPNEYAMSINGVPETITSISIGGAGVNDGTWFGDYGNTNDVAYLGTANPTTTDANFAGQFTFFNFMYYDSFLSIDDITRIYNNGDILDPTKDLETVGTLLYWLPCGEWENKENSWPTIYEQINANNATAIEVNQTDVVTRSFQPNPSYLLDDFPSAEVAWSLREISSSWVGLDILQVRRSSDNTLEWFNATEIIDGTLEAWVGGGDGFVRELKNQAGGSEGKNITQSTNLLQPKIVSSGELVKINGKPAISGDGTQWLRTQVLTLGATGDIGLSYFRVGQYNQLNNISSLSQLTPSVLNNDRRIINDGNDSERVSSARLQGGNIVWSTGFGQQQHIGSIHNTPAAQMLGYKNGYQMAVQSSTTNTLNIQASGGWVVLGGGYVNMTTTPSSIWNNAFQEMIWYLSDNSANREAIETNMNTYYKVY
jgi:hypothetical protein